MSKRKATNEGMRLAITTGGTGNPVDITAQTIASLATIEETTITYPVVWLENPEATTFAMKDRPAAAAMESANGSVTPVTFGAKRGAGSADFYVSALVIEYEDTAGLLDPDLFGRSTALTNGMDVVFDNGSDTTVASGLLDNGRLSTWAIGGNVAQWEGSATNRYVFRKEFKKPIRLTASGHGFAVVINDNISTTSVTRMHAYLEGGQYQ